MSDGSPIEWLRRPGTKPATWNPIRALNKFTGKRGWFCTHVHEGCRNCYAERLNVKDGDTGGNGIPYRAQDRELVDIILHDATLLQPLKWKSPRTIFVCSMTDVFGEWVADEWLDSIFMIATRCPQHTFIMLTKRPARMRDYLVGLLKNPMAHALSLPWKDAAGKQIFIDAPLPNVWGLVSCSTQEDADKFIPILEQTPLARKGVSLEPLLGPIDLTRCGSHYTGSGPLHLWQGGGDKTWRKQHMHPAPEIQWVIVGGESGKNARIMHPKWVRSLRDQCAAADVPFFLKQWGEWSAADKTDDGFISAATGDLGLEARVGQETFSGDGAFFAKVGKKAAGRLLDGREHNAFPVTDVSVAQPALASHENKNREATRA